MKLYKVINTSTKKIIACVLNIPMIKYNKLFMQRMWVMSRTHWGQALWEELYVILS